MADLGLGALANFAAFLPDVDPTSIGQRWKLWSDRYENLLVALDITNHDRKKALLLHLACEVVYEIYDGLVIATVAQDAETAFDNVYIATKRALNPGNTKLFWST